jgi:hypothetical protein
LQPWVVNSGEGLPKHAKQGTVISGDREPRVALEEKIALLHGPPYNSQLKFHDSVILLGRA